MKKCLWALTLVLYTAVAQCQTSSEWSLKIGWQQLRLKDEAASALVYQGQLPTLGLQWERQTPYNIWQGQLQGAYGSFFPRDYPYRELVFFDRNDEGVIDTVRFDARGKNIVLRANIGWLHRLNGHGSKSWQAVGAVISDELYVPQGFVTPGLMNALSFAPQAMAGLKSGNKGLLTVSISVPIVALTTRLPYHQTVSMPGGTTISGLFEQGSHWNSLGQYRQLRLQIGYKHRLGERYQAGLQYEFATLQHTSPRDLNMQHHALNAFIGLTSHRRGE